MKGSPDLIPDAALDPSRVCKGKGVVTLRATLVHIDDEGLISEEPNVITVPSDWTNQINGDSSKAGLAEGGSDTTADLPPLSNTQCQPNLSESLKENQSPSDTDIQICPASSPSSVYPCTSSVNPTIVLLQHNRDTTPERDRSPDPGRDSVSPVPDMDWKRLRLSLNSPVLTPLNKPIVPVRNTEKSKDWYKSMFKQIHRIPDDGPSPYDYLEDVKSVPRSRSDMDVESRGRSMPVPTRSSSLKPSAKRNEWEPPDKKVDTRKYRVEPKSIFEYEPGKSSVLHHDRTSSPSFSPLETASDLQQYSSSKSGHNQVEENDGSSRDSEPPECDRHVYKSVLEGGDIPLQGLRALNRRHGSSSSSKVDYKGGNGYIISPCSSVNSRTVLASNAIGNQCKSMKPLSAAKACIPQILPSKFKPNLLPPSGDSQTNRTRAVRNPKAHSCEDLYNGVYDRDYAVLEERESRKQSDSTCEDGLRNASCAIRRSTSEFSSLYKSMHRIQQPSSAGCSPQGSVRSLASLFEKAKAARGERSEAEDEENIPRDSVSSRVTEFEMIIQQSSSAPCRSSSLPTLHSSHSHSPTHLYMVSAVSAESLLIADAAQTVACSPVEVEGKSSEEEGAASSVDVQNERTESPFNCEAEVEQIFKQSSQEFINQSGGESKCDSPASPPKHGLIHHHHHHHHILQNLNHELLLKPSKCKGSCPASYTRFTTILRHERQQALTQQERPRPLEKRTTLPGNLFLMGPAPFRLRKNLQSHQTRKTLATKVTLGFQRPYALSPELRPRIPQRLSSLEVLERLSNTEGSDTDQLSNQHCLDANGNLLQLLAAQRRGGYIHPFNTVTLLSPPSVDSH